MGDVLTFRRMMPPVIIQTRFRLGVIVGVGAGPLFLSEGDHRTLGGG